MFKNMPQTDKPVMIQNIHRAIDILLDVGSITQWKLKGKISRLNLLVCSAIYKTSTCWSCCMKIVSFYVGKDVTVCNIFCL